jgi:glutathione synthase/RimK-type ligase-like ATP-grasp enzyme
VFPAEIYSQHSEQAAVDWRAAYQDLRYGVHQLPEEIRKKCLELMQKLGLIFATIDMVLTPDGRYVFLELNPNGQWEWIENATSLPICSTLVDMLTE